MRLRALVLKKTSLDSDTAFAAGKNKSRPKTVQTPENTILSLSEPDSFDKNITASWIQSGFRSGSINLLRVQASKDRRL